MILVIFLACSHSFTVLDSSIWFKNTYEAAYFLWNIFFSLKSLFFSLIPSLRSSWVGVFVLQSMLIHYSLVLSWIWAKTLVIWSSFRMFMVLKGWFHSVVALKYIFSAFNMYWTSWLLMLIQCVFFLVRSRREFLKKGKFTYSFSCLNFHLQWHNLLDFTHYSLYNKHKFLLRLSFP